MSGLIREQVALAPLTTLKTGGAAAYFATITTILELEQAVSFAQQKKLPVCVLGGGSNMLVSDQGYSGLILQIRLLGLEYQQIDSHTHLVTVSAGENFDALIAETTSKGWWGLENLSHIPGSVGATPVQNVGAYGVEVADSIVYVTVFDIETKKIRTLQNHECNFSYRHSIFKEKINLIIVSVTFALSTKVNPKITYADLAKLPPCELTPGRLRSAVIAIRADKFPDWTKVGTAGSFFKNPTITKDEAIVLLGMYPDIPNYPAPHNQVKVSLGYILDKICGLKGFTLGLVRLYEKQALVLIAETGATTAEIKNFAEIISEKVFEKTLIHIEQEVTKI